MTLGKKTAIVIIIAILSVCGIIWPAPAESGPAIRIAGELRQFQPGPLLIEGRTMVPVRFVVEDPAFQGKVYWDGLTQKVALDCRGKHIEFIIGSPIARVDGVARDLDAPPFICQGRSYIPLRFLAEALQATVGWDNAEREVDISFGYKPEVFAYYYYTPWEEYALNIDLFSDVVLRWFKTDREGRLDHDYQDSYGKVMEYARTHNVKTHLGLALMDREELSILLNNPGRRENLIGRLHAEVQKDRYDGVNIDFEFMAPTDAEVFTQFLRELKHTLGPDKIVSVAVSARTGHEKWPVAYQYEAIGRIADRVVVMAYDYCYPDSAAGPVAPLWWVQDVAAYMTDHIPRGKILLGLPTYGYDWGSGRAVTVTGPKLAVTQDKYRVSAGFDWESMSPYHRYTDENGCEHVVWLEDENSLAAKWDLATSNHLGGIAFWRIGNGFDDLYKVLRR